MTKICTLSTKAFRKTLFHTADIVSTSALFRDSRHAAGGHDCQSSQAPVVLGPQWTLVSEGQKNMDLTPGWRQLSCLPTIKVMVTNTWIRMENNEHPASASTVFTSSSMEALQ
ncbi:hypothetical protein [Desulfobulbus alkaliphilus]|uniref:hypothetical protein n=1 Tax=Desulfobulbus alkaliphilus TaxID=869814 RepID=UPI00196249AB|nr:hypothetical protein [Desulfobulbus alkaliphilus]MBM9535948.1 hypothetical protein [Desulfobulbus alkaliphilus]